MAQQAGQQPYSWSVWLCSCSAACYEAPAPAPRAPRCHERHAPPGRDLAHRRHGPFRMGSVAPAVPAMVRRCRDIPFDLHAEAAEEAPVRYPWARPFVAQVPRPPARGFPFLMTDDKPCLVCGVVMKRGAAGRAYWKTRRFCSNACHTQHRADNRDSLFWSNVDVRGDDDCWPWLIGTDPDGYGRSKHVGEQRAHRVAYRLVCGPIPDGEIVRHTCDNPPCCNPRHLLTGTHADNAQDKVDRGRSADREGEFNTQAKLTPEQARSIFLDRRYYAEIAAEYEISKNTVWDIKAKRSWRHLHDGGAA